MMRNGWRRFWRARDGLGAVELGFIAPFLLILLLGILDFGMAYWQQMQIANAADAGAKWGMDNPYGDGSSISAISRSATNLPLISVYPENPWGCATDGGVVRYPQSATCPDNTSPKQYIIVNARICYATLFTWPGLNYCSAGDTNCTGCTSDQIALSAQSVVLK